MYKSAQAAIMKYCRLGGLDSKNVLSHSSGDWKSKIKVPVWLGSGENPPLGLQMDAFLLCPPMIERE